MDVISTIKVRNADGSLSDSLPIGTVSDYITIAADGSSLSSILGNVDLNRYGSIQSQINALGGGSGIADGVVYVGDDPEDTEDIPIEKINGISFNAEGDVLKAYWQADGEYKEAQLAPIEGGGGEVPDGVIYVDFENSEDTTITPIEQINGISIYYTDDNKLMATWENNGTQEIELSGGNGGSGFNDIYAEDTLNLGRVENSVVGEYSATIGYYNKATGYAAVAEGAYVEANGSYSHAEGRSNVASGSSSHAEGENTTASGNYSHAEGYYSQATESYSHAEGYSTVASQYGAHAEGDDTNATGQAAHAEGNNTEASGSYSHAEGSSTKATQGQAHAEGILTIASGYNSHAEGQSTEAKGSQSHAEGTGTIASGNNQHTQGMYNIEDTENKYAHIVGGGKYNERKNIHTLDWEGNAVFAGDVTDGNGDSIASLAARIAALEAIDIAEGGAY